jgi:hypothetical protein
MKPRLMNPRLMNPRLMNPRSRILLCIVMAMIGNSAVMFAFNIATSHWLLATAWLCAGGAWCIVDMKERQVLLLHDLCLSQQHLIVIQHQALVKGGIIIEEAPEEEEGAAP